MALLFEWDSRKAEVNLRKHGVSFPESESVFSDPLSVTIADPVHSIDEARFVIVGLSAAQRLLVVVHTERGRRIRILGAREATNAERKQYETAWGIHEMAEKYEVRDEYDFAEGVRGKYAEELPVDRRTIVLDPDVAAAFPDAKSVNDALRSLIVEREVRTK